MLNDVKKSYRDLKEEIYETEVKDSNKDFFKLVTLKNINDDLREMLVLLHGNYSSELQEVRSRYDRLLTKLIDNDIEAVTITDIQLVKHKERAEESIVAKIAHFSSGLSRLTKFMFTVIFILVIFIGLYEFFPTTVDKAINGFKSIFGGELLNTNSQIIQQTLNN